MKARVSYDPDKMRWVIEIKTDSTDWDVMKWWTVQNMGATSGLVSDTILDELVRIQRNGWEIEFSDDYPMYKGGK